MALIHAELTRPDYGFTVTDSADHTMFLDIPVEQGGHNTGLRPMQTLLGALCGCSGVDIVSILKKQRQDLQSLKISADGEREPGKEPSLWKHIVLRFDIGGTVEPAKAIRSVELSMEKYCSVAETLRLAGAKIDWKVFLNGEALN
jgi:putative redox protein